MWIDRKRIAEKIGGFLEESGAGIGKRGTLALADCREYEKIAGRCGGAWIPIRGNGRDGNIPAGADICRRAGGKPADGAEISLCRGFPRERTGSFYGGGNAAADGMAEQANAFFGGGKQRATENRTAQSLSLVNRQSDLKTCAANWSFIHSQRSKVSCCE